MGTLLADLRYAARLLRKSPGFTLVAVLMLGLGIGAGTAIFSVVNGVLLRPLPYLEPERLAMIWNDYGAGQSLPAVSPGDTLDYCARLPEVAEFASANGGTVNLSGEGDPEQLDIGLTSADFFPLLGVQPILGRLYTAEEAVVNGPRVVVLGHRLWTRRFGADPAIAGKTIRLNGEPRTVLGVLPAGFELILPAERFQLRDSELWGPQQIDASKIGRNWTLFTVIARLRPGKTMAELQQSLANVAEQLRNEHEVHRQSGLRIRAVPLEEDVVKGVRPALLALLFAVLLVLLIACANVANLLLARQSARSRETALRGALGASRGRLLRQALTESLLLALLGGAFGLLVAGWGLPLLLALRPESLPRAASIGLDGAALAFTAAVSLATTLLFGLLPAMHAAEADPGPLLRSGHLDTGTPAHQAARRLLIVGEIALSLVLLVGAGLCLRSFASLQEVRLGFNPDRLLTFALNAPGQRYQPEQAVLFYQQLERKLRQLPSVQAVGAVSKLPLTGEGSQTPYAWDEASAQQWESISADWRTVTPGAFEALGIRLLAGRNFAEHDDAAHPHVLIIDTLLARRAFGSASPIGRRLMLEGEKGKESMEVIGLIEHPRLHDLSRDVRAQIWQPHGQARGGRLSLLIKTQGDPLAVARAAEATVHSLDPELAVYAPRPLTALVEEARAPARFLMTLISLFGAIALVMASVGLFGVISYSVRQRTQEIGVRMALGAQQRDVLRMVLREGVQLAVPGIALGLVASLATTRVLRGLLVGVSATDPVTFSSVSALLCGVALLACWLPARRAAGVDPAIALRDST